MTDQQFTHPKHPGPFRRPARGTITVAGQAVSRHTSDASLAAMGCKPYTPPPQVETQQPTEQERLAAQYAALRADHAAGFAAFRETFLTVATSLQSVGASLPDPLTFEGLAGLLASLPGEEWTRAGLVLLTQYNAVIYACGDMQTAYRMLPLILTDTTLAEGTGL